MLEISSAGLALIKKYEGCRLTAYKCPAGVWTIGYGHTEGVQEGDEIIQAEADALLQLDASSAMGSVDQLVRVPLKQCQADALASFVFNLGHGALKSSTLLRKLNAGDYEGASHEITRWDKATVKGQLVQVRGLTLRRSAEQYLFNGNNR